MKIYEKLIGTSPREAIAAGWLPYPSCRRHFAVIFTACFLTMIVSVIYNTRCYAQGNNPHLLVRDTNFGNQYGRLKKASLSQPDGPRETEPLSCELVHFAADRGVCITARRGPSQRMRPSSLVLTFSPYSDFRSKGLQPTYVLLPMAGLQR